jgi:hypothetical protein
VRGCVARGGRDEGDAWQGGDATRVTRGKGGRDEGDAWQGATLSCHTFIMPCLTTSRRLVQTCGGNGGEREWAGGQGSSKGKQVQASAGSLIVNYLDSRLSCSRS